MIILKTFNRANNKQTNKAGQEIKKNNQTKAGRKQTNQGRQRKRKKNKVRKEVNINKT